MITTKADEWFSKFIRLRDADEQGLVRCCTCGRINHWKSVDCGHHIKRQHMASRFSEVNCAGQCKKCNCFEQGNDAKFKEFIVKKYGQQQYDLLEASKRSNRKLMQFEINEIAKHYKQKATEMAKQKGLLI